MLKYFVIALSTLTFLPMAGADTTRYILNEGVYGEDATAAQTDCDLLWPSLNYDTLNANCNVEAVVIDYRGPYHYGYSYNDRVYPPDYYRYGGYYRDHHRYYPSDRMSYFLSFGDRGFGGYGYYQRGPRFGGHHGFHRGHRR